MKKFFLFVFSLFIFFKSPTSIQAFEIDRINSFHSTITINQDTSITIQETLEYETNLQKHGIYRYIPVDYNRSGMKDKLRIDQIKVTDDRGEKIPYEQSYDGKNLTLKIGDPDATFTGKKTYLLSYRVEKAINQFETQDELYWDITGEGWQIPILSSSAEVVSSHAQIQKIACYSGQFGSDDGLCQSQITKDQADFIYPNQILYGDNMTIVVGLNKDNQLIFSSKFDNFLSWILHNWSILLSPLPLLGMIYWWWQKGRDFEFLSQNVFDLDEKKPTRLIPFSFSTREPFVYEPLKDLTPGQAGAIIDEKVDNQDLVAEILELARKKYLKIELIEKKKLFGKERDYQLIKLKSSSSSLPEVQQYLFDQLFKGRETVKISTLKGTFYLTMDKARQMLDKTLVDKKLYTSPPNNARGMGFAWLGISTTVVIGLLIWQVVPFDIIWPIFVVALQVPFMAILAYKMPQKTAVGHNLSLQARGLKKSIRYGAWREKIKEKNLFIEEVLPFAVALGVVDRLARDMKELNIQPPEYLSTPGLTTWSTSQFVQGFSNEMASGLSYNPSSSSSSGGSGFGGSSGGGGGGGGGGSW